jgi:hypothetical protein
VLVLDIKAWEMIFFIIILMPFLFEYSPLRTLNGGLLMENNMDTQNTNSAAEEKTFTQDDVNRIIGERLAKEKAKGEQDFSKREQKLQQREICLTAKEMLSDKGLSVKLIDALNCTNKETLEKSISILEEVLKENKEKASQVKLKGIIPVDRSSRTPSETPDDTLREAMGLSK